MSVMQFPVCHVILPSCHWLIVCSLFTGVPCPVISLVYLSPNVCHVSLSSIVSCDQVYVHVFLFHATSCFCFMFYLMFINIKLHFYLQLASSGSLHSDIHFDLSYDLVLEVYRITEKNRNK